MTIKPRYLIIAAILLTLIIWFGLDRNSKYQANKKIIDSIKNEKEAEIDRLSVEIDSISEVAETYRKQAEKDYQEGQDLEEEKENLENTDYENEPYHINSADSLRELISRRFYNRKP